MALFVGTSGWDYKEWRGGLYPVYLPERRFLEHYSRVFSACEINATFYRLQSPETFSRWVEATPAGFSFAVKAHRRLTHRRRVADDDAWYGFQERFRSSVSALGDRLACVLYQFPPNRERDDEVLERLLDALSNGLSCAFEFRHDSWESEDVASRIARAGATVCLSDQSGRPPERLPPGPFAYVRLRATRYTETEREGWRMLLEHEAQRRHVFAFAKHKDVPAADPFTGPGLAQWLVEQHPGV